MLVTSLWIFSIFVAIWATAVTYLYVRERRENEKHGESMEDVVYVIVRRAGFDPESPFGEWVNLTYVMRKIRAKYKKENRRKPSPSEVVVVLFELANTGWLRVEKGSDLTGVDVPVKPDVSYFARSNGRPKPPKVKLSQGSSEVEGETIST